MLLNVKLNNNYILHQNRSNSLHEIEYDSDWHTLGGQYNKL